MTRAQIRAKNEVLNVHQEYCVFNVFISKLEPKTVKVALEHLDWVDAMQSELTEFERNKVWSLIPKPKDVSLIGFKWIFKNKTDKEGSVDPTLSRKEVVNHLMLVQIYVDDIVFDSTDPLLLKEFEELMKSKFEMSMMGKINNFLGLHIHQSKEDIFKNQEKYTCNLLERFGMTNSIKLKVPIVVGTLLNPSLEKPAVDLRTVSLGLWYPSKTGFFVQDFSHADLGGCQLDRKSTIGNCQLLDGNLVSWQSKKQTCVSISTAEAEYMVAATCTS
ncbi:uncharacterized mitochondrial protein AtMg00810-like [Lactuca sativa]|uniref:uncharacterized mitochondrial protein AtMg00810-like n=1 Tax=Lactuca sativa TaxID=4236 RepID=UPI000CD93D52|nr:uncharacterized mitochondrial protein AtMg00810-like [Lactuca sativa]